LSKSGGGTQSARGRRRRKGVNRQSTKRAAPKSIAGHGPIHFRGAPEIFNIDLLRAIN